LPGPGKGGGAGIVQGPEINGFCRGGMDATAKGLEEERKAVQDLGLVK